MKPSSDADSKATLVVRDVRPDSRGRVALGKALIDLEEVTFNVYRDDRGRIVLDPQVSVPASEVWLYRNPTALASVRRGLGEAAAKKSKPARSFARYAGDDEP